MLAQKFKWLRSNLESVQNVASQLLTCWEQIKASNDKPTEHVIWQKSSTLQIIFLEVNELLLWKIGEML